MNIKTINELKALLNEFNEFLLEDNYTIINIVDYVEIIRHNFYTIPKDDDIATIEMLREDIYKLHESKNYDKSNIEAIINSILYRIINAGGDMNMIMINTEDRENTISFIRDLIDDAINYEMTKYHFNRKQALLLDKEGTNFEQDIINNKRVYNCKPAVLADYIYSTIAIIANEIIYID